MKLKNLFIQLAIILGAVVCLTPSNFVYSASPTPPAATTATTAAKVNVPAATKASSLNASIFAAIPGSITCKTDIAGSGCNSIPTLIDNIVKWIFSIAGAVFFFMFLIGGIQYLTAGGSSQQTETAIKTILWNVIGMAIMLAGYTAVSFFINAFK